MHAQVSRSAITFNQAIHGDADTQWVNSLASDVPAIRAMAKFAIAIDEVVDESHQPFRWMGMPSFSLKRELAQMATDIGDRSNQILTYCQEQRGRGRESIQLDIYGYFQKLTGFKDPDKSIYDKIVRLVEIINRKCIERQREPLLVHPKVDEDWHQHGLGEMTYD